MASGRDRHIRHAGACRRQLYVLYVRAAEHGMGAGPTLLEAVVGHDESATLWVADPNPHAQAFSRKHGFVADGWPRSPTARQVRGSVGSAVDGRLSGSGRDARHR